MHQPTQKSSVPLREKNVNDYSRSNGIAEVKVNCNHSAQHWFSFMFYLDLDLVLSRPIVHGAFCG